MERNISEESRSRYLNVRAFLRLIRACEGTDALNGYRYLFGSTKDRELLFDDMSKHPNIRKSFTQTDGTIGYTTAAGAYQIINPTWCRVQALLELPDFGPDSQDRAAIYLITEAGQLINVELGLVRTAMNGLWKVWASLPASKYAQPKRTEDFAIAAYEAGGGKVT